MNGLTSSSPSPSVVRLTVSGFLLMLVQSALLLLSPELDRASGLLIWILTPLAFLAFVAALLCVPEPPEPHLLQRHGRSSARPCSARPHPSCACHRPFPCRRGRRP